MKKTTLVTTPKTATLRIVGNDAKLKLFSLFDCITKVSGQIKDKLHTLKGTEHDGIYQEYIKTMGCGRGCATTVVGSTKKDREEYAEKSFARHRKLGIFPFYTAPAEGFDLRTASYTYTVNAGIHTQLDSLEQCDALVKKDYNAQKAEVERLFNEVTTTFPSLDIVAFCQWIDTLKSMGWAYNADFYNFFVQNMFPSMKEGKQWTIAYKIADKNRRYGGFRYSSAAADEIKSHPEYWGVLANHDVLDYYKAINKLNRTKETANYTPTTLTKSPIRINYANNGVPFSISSDNTYAYMTFSLPSTIGEKPQKIQVKCAYRKFTHKNEPRKSCYLDGLTVEPNGSGKYICKYSVNNKRPQVAHLNECFLRLKIHNHQWFEKYVNGTLTPKDGALNPSFFDFYFDLSMGVIITPHHKLDSSEVGVKANKKSLQAFYSRAFPEVKDLGNQSNVIEDFSCPVNKPHNLMGIDIGIRNPYAYCIKDNHGVEIARGHLDGCRDDYYKIYKSFTMKTEAFVELLKETKDFLFGDDEAFVSTSAATLGIDLNSYKTYLTPRRNMAVPNRPEKTTIHQLRQDKTWSIKNALYSLLKEFKALKMARMTDSDWRRAIYWVQAINGIINAQKAFHNFGSYYDKTSKCRINGTGKGFAMSYYEEANGVNEDMFKKFANSLLPIIQQHGVSVVVLENMDALRGNRDKSSIENQTFNLWPVGDLKRFLESYLAPFNVCIVEVSEQNTSQIYKDRWIDKRDGDCVYINDKLLDVHADENAAENIVDRALSNHTNLYSLHMTGMVDNYWVPTAMWSPKGDGGKKLRGFLTRLYGSSNVVFTQNGGILSKASISIKDLKKTHSKSPIDKKYARRINKNCWVLLEG